MLFVCLFEPKFSCSLVIWNGKISDKLRGQPYQAFSSACVLPLLLLFQKLWWTHAHNGRRPAPCNTGGRSAFPQPLCLCQTVQNKTQAHVHLRTLILPHKQNKITYFPYCVPQKPCEILCPLKSNEYLYLIPLLSAELLMLKQVLLHFCFKTAM